MEKVRLNFDSTDVRRKALKKKLDEEGRTMKWVLNQMIELYLNGEILKEDK